MMPGFDPVGLLAAVAVTGLSGCASAAPASVVITFANNPPVQSSALSRRQLSRMPVDTQFSHGIDERFSVNGITVDRTTPTYAISYEATLNAETESVCLRVDHVGIMIDYSPQIYIASEYRAGTCRYDQTLKHEVRHVDTHVIAISEYLPQMKSAVEGAVITLGVAELAGVADIEQAKATVAENIRQALAKSVAEMRNAALLRQQQIDTRQEYLRTSKACP